MAKPCSYNQINPAAMFRMNFIVSDAGGAVGPFHWANAITNPSDTQYLSFDGWFGFVWRNDFLFRIGGRSYFAS